jgi:uncharacterized iron-regulated membrane protein
MNDLHRTVSRMGSIVVVAACFVGLAAMHWDAVHHISKIADQAKTLDATENAVRSEQTLLTRESIVKNREAIIENGRLLLDNQRVLSEIQAAMLKVKSDLAKFNSSEPQPGS